MIERTGSIAAQLGERREVGSGLIVLDNFRTVARCCARGSRRLMATARFSMLDLIETTKHKPFDIA
jgi:hypothetical protein